MKIEQLLKLLSIVFLVGSMLTYTIFMTTSSPTLKVTAKGSFVVPNTPPTLHVKSNYTVLEGQRIELEVNATDINDDPLTFYYSGYLDGNPHVTDYDDSGNHIGTVTVSDGHSNTSSNVSIKVIDRYCENISYITTNSNKFSPGVPIHLKGYNFTLSSNVSLSVQKLNSSTNLTGFPKTLNTSYYGNFTYKINTSNMSLGRYLITVTDKNNYCLTKHTKIITLSPYNFQGIIFNPDYQPVPSNVTVHHENQIVHLDDEVYDIWFDYGKYYDIVIEPENITGLDKIIYRAMINHGNTTDILGLDNTSLSASYKNFSTLFAYNPVLENYKYIKLNLTHKPGKQEFVYKCPGWDFENSNCPDEKWEYIATFPAEKESMMITLPKGDPGIGLSSEFFDYYCGDGVCNGKETSSNCPEDCEEETSGGGGGGGFVAPCQPEWNCTEWSDCVDGKSIRQCSDLNECHTDKPIEVKQCKQPVKVSPFDLSKESLSFNLNRKEYQKDSLRLYNNLNELIKLKFYSPEDMLQFNKSLYMGPHTTDTFPITLLASKPAGTYDSYIRIINKNYTPKIPIKITIKEPIKHEYPAISERVLAESELITKPNYIGNTLHYRIDLKRMDCSNKTIIPVTLKTTLTRNDEILRYYEEQVNLETQTTIFRNITLTKNLESGMYNINILAKTAETHSPTKINFVLHNKISHFLYQYLYLIILTGLFFILLILLLVGLQRERKHKKTKMKDRKCLSKEESLYK